ncbi:hypothetical protein ACFE04_030836 [Oxalis oulophora]
MIDDDINFDDYESFDIDIENDIQTKIVPASKEMIDNLGTVEIDEEKSIECSVCFEEFLIGSQATSMPCSHIFHSECITQWLQKNNSCVLFVLNSFSMNTEKQSQKHRFVEGRKVVVDGLDIPTIVMFSSRQLLEPQMIPPIYPKADRTRSDRKCYKPCGPDVLTSKYIDHVEYGRVMNHGNQIEK